MKGRLIVAKWPFLCRAFFSSERGFCGRARAAKRQEQDVKPASDRGLLLFTIHQLFIFEHSAKLLSEFRSVGMSMRCDGMSCCNVDHFILGSKDLHCAVLLARILAAIDKLSPGLGSCCCHTYLLFVRCARIISPGGDFLLEISASDPPFTIQHSRLTINDPRLTILDFRFTIHAL